MIPQFNGIPIIESPFCVRTVWNFKNSKNRSARLYKKLLKRFGGIQSYEVPTAYIVHGKLTGHPNYIKKMLEEGKIAWIV